MSSNKESIKGCKELYNAVYINREKALDSKLLTFKDQEVPACGFIIDNMSYDFKDENPYTKIFYVEEGSLNFKINDINTIVEKGYFVLINLHSYVEVSPNTENTRYFYFNFKRSFFHPDFMKKLSKYENFYNFINFCLMGKNDNKAHLAYEYNTLKSQLILYTLLSYIEEGEYKLLESGLLHLFENLTYSKDSKIVPSLSTLINASIVNSIIQYISANYTNITLDELSKYFNYHPNYISKLIKEETGKTFQNHVQEAKMKQAAFLLINTDAYIKNICFDLGYLDTSHFNKVFKEAYKCTPSEYRSKYKKEKKKP